MKGEKKKNWWSKQNKYSEKNKGAWRKTKIGKQKQNLEGTTKQIDNLEVVRSETTTIKPFSSSPSASCNVGTHVPCLADTSWSQFLCLHLPAQAGIPLPLHLPLDYPALS